MANHIIHKQKIVVKTNFEALTQTAADEVSEACKNELPRLLETVFDELISDDEIVRIDSLKVDLGTLPREEMKQLFAVKAKEKIKEAIVVKIEKKNDGNGVVIIHKQQSLLHSLFHFLQQGTLPWFVAIKKSEDWEKQIEQGFGKDDWIKLIDWIKEKSEQQPIIVKRLAYQFSDLFLKTILLNSSNIEPDKWEAIYNDLKTLLRTSSNKNENGIRNEIWLNSLLYFFQQKQTGQTIEEHVKQIVAQQPIAKGAIEKASDDKNNETQYVSNCGTVLLHPFLLSFFTELNLVKENGFVSVEACQRAVLLLHYLATGETETEEWNAVLAKVLCGLALNETLPNIIELTNKEREESEALLQSIIRYWPPLKNTSVNGLRQSFLQREGKLEAKQNGWLLTVEQKTIDVLLDKLPWGFSTIKLPWMNEMMSVDWH